MIMYKPRKIHVVADAMSRLLDIVEPRSVLNQTTYVSLFYTKLEWLHVKENLKI
jgi:hypothetical protein